MDATKVQALQTANRLRTFSRYFAFDPNNLTGFPTKKPPVDKKKKKATNPAADKKKEMDDKPQIFFMETTKLLE